MRAIRSNNSRWSRRRSNRTTAMRTRRQFITDVASYGIAAIAAGELGDIEVVVTHWVELHCLVGGLQVERGQALAQILESFAQVLTRAIGSVIAP